MQLTKHRDTFTLTMSSEDLVFLVNNLGSDPQTTVDQEKVTKVLKELTKFQQFAISFEQYMLEQEALAESHQNHDKPKRRRKNNVLLRTYYPQEYSAE